MPRSIQKGTRVGPTGIAPGKVVTTGSKKGNLGASKQYNHTGTKSKGPNYKQKDPMVNLKQDV